MSETFESNIVETEILDITMTKTTGCPLAMVGREVCYTITITNNSPVDVDAMAFRDELDERVIYKDGSFIVDGVAQEPEIIDNVIQCNIDVPMGETVVITFCVTVIGVSS